jgi:hypothetical protein
MKAFIDWLYASPLSQLFQTVTWIIPTAQIVHIVTLSVIFASMLMLDLHLLGLTLKDRDTATVAQRFVPGIWYALPIMLASGLILIIAEPNRQLQNPAFYLKMALLLIVIVMTLALQRSIAKRPVNWGLPRRDSAYAKLIAIASIVLWTGIIACGRLIAYV